LDQTLKASSALLRHIKSEAKRKEEQAATKSLLATNDDSSAEGDSDQAEPIWLVITTKKHVVDKKRLKPGKIPLPHSLYKPTSSTICLITADPQRSFKDVIDHPAFPTSIATQITQTIGISKLLTRYRSFESRRQLHSEHDIFLADDRIITRLPKALGNAFYKGSKRPIPVNLMPYKQKDQPGNTSTQSKESPASKVAPPLQFAKEIESTLSCALVHLSPSVTTSIRVGLSNFKPEEVAENIEAAVEGMVKKFVPKGWRNIRAIHIKGPNTMALPIWLAEELWQDEEDVLENEEAAKALAIANQKGTKRKGREGEDVALSNKKQVKKVEDSDLGPEMAERRAKLREAKKAAKEEVTQDLEAPKKSKKLEVEGSKLKVKTKKTRAISASA
jgi:ribosome biogenesis protein UTP30